MLIEYTVHTVQDGEHKIIIEIVVKDVSVKKIMKESDGDKNENEDENENEQRVMVEKKIYIKVNNG